MASQLRIGNLMNIHNKHLVTLRSNPLKTTSELWKLTKGQLLDPVDVTQNTKVFLLYPEETIPNALDVVVCTVCRDLNYEDATKLPTSWEINIGSSHSTGKLLRHLEQNHGNDYARCVLRKQVTLIQTIANLLN